MNSMRGAWIGAAFAALAVIALAAFWRPYFSLPAVELLARPTALHLHAATVVAWLALLVAQPLWLRAGRPALHRALGRFGFGLAVAVVVSSLWLAVEMTRPPAGQPIEAFRYGLFFVQIATAALFAASVALGVWKRRERAVHARAMLASGLCFLDPVFARVFMHVLPPFAGSVEYGSVVVAAAVGAVLAASDRGPARWVLWAWLAGFGLLSGIALVIGDWTPWRAMLDRTLG